MNLIRVLSIGATRLLRWVWTGEEHSNAPSHQFYGDVHRAHVPPGSAAALFDDGYGRSGLAGLPNPISAIIDTDYASNKKDARQSECRYCTAQ